MPNAKLVSSTEDKSQSLLQRPHLQRSTATNDSILSEDAHELGMIFTSSQDQSQQASPHKRRVYNTETTDSKRHSRSSTSRLQEVLRKRLSRDSVFSTKSSRRKSKITVSEEDADRRKELKRALHQRLRDELLADRTASQGGYDVDAEMITTPKVTTRRSGGAIQMSPKELSDLMRRMNISNSNNELRDSYELPADALDTDAKIPANYEHTNASKVTSVWEDDLPDSETPPQYAINEIRQIFMSPRKGSVEIVEIVRRSTDASPTSPMDRSDTVVQVPKARVRSTGQSSATSYPGVIEVPLSPDLLPLRMPSITESVQGDWRLSCSGSRKGSGLSRSYGTGGRLSTSAVPKPNRPSYPKGWRPETILLLDPGACFRATDSGDSGDTGGGSSSAGHAHKCDPSSEEQDFGGVDGENGKDKSFSNARDANGELDCAPRARKRYSIEAEPQTGSPRKVLTTAMSLPQLPNMARHGRSKSSGTCSLAYSLRERRPHYSSSSGYFAPINERPVYPDNASSIYTYAGGSALPSPDSSVTRFGNRSDKLKLLDALSDSGGLPFYARNSSLNVSTIGLTKDLHDRNSSRRRTIDTTSFQSSTASFRAQELAAAAARIVPKPRTLTKARTSRFKEELGEEMAKVKSLGRKSMLGRGFSKKGNFRSYDGSEEWYSSGKRQGYGFAFVPEERQAAAVWERALRDHAEEIASTPPKRPGSLSHVFGGRSLKGKASSSKLKTKAGIAREKSRLNVLEIGKLNDTSPVIIVTPVKAASRAPKSPASPSWGKYPSHTRALRSESPASEADHVHSHDFASAAAPTNDSPHSRRSFLGKRKKSRSMTFSRHVFRSWSRLYKSHSSGNVKAQARGIRSSVSGSGAPNPYSREGLVLASLRVEPMAEKEVAKVLFPMSEAGESTVTEEGEGGDVYITKKSAKAWSRLYEECVKQPRDTDTEAGSIREGKGADLRPRRATETGTSMSMMGREVSEAEAGDMRASTVEFQRELRAHEEEERRRVLEATERLGVA
ncbi:hypothetical protein MMC18_001617 [Xylographa bjoerkii]|nr:hypothetical protein [Xylographa bjoerkii]